MGVAVGQNQNHEFQTQKNWERFPMIYYMAKEILQDQVFPLSFVYNPYSPQYQVLSEKLNFALALHL